MPKDSNLLNHAPLRAEHQRHVRRINDIFIEAQLSVQGLGTVLDSVAAMQERGQKRFKIDAPSTKGRERNISRDLDLIREIISERIASKEYVQSIVFAVALVESYISSSLVNVIRTHPQKILVSPKGNEPREGTSLSIDVREVVNATSLDTLIAEKAAQRVRDAGYAKPESYFSYCAQVFGFEFGEDLRQQYIEIKATRDIHVHNDGIANSIYVRKVGTLARAAEGESLPVDGEYLRESIACLKQVLADTYRGLKDKHGRNPRLHEILMAADAVT